MDNAEKLRIALLRILNSNILRLFGCLIYNFDINLINTDSILWYEEDKIPKNIRDIVKDKLTANVTLIDGKPVMNVYTSFIETKNVGELIFVMLHEILHILDGHCLRGHSMNPELFGLAADHVINVPLRQDVSKKILKKVSVPKDCFIIEELAKKDRTLEEVYHWLEKHSQTKTMKIGQANPGGGQGDGQGSEGQPFEIKMLEVDMDGKKRVMVTDIIPASGDNINKAATESIKAEARAVMNNDSIIGKGDTSGSINGLIKKMIEVKIPWTHLLERAISSKVVPSSDNRNWSRIQKRPYAMGLTLPGFDVDEKPAILILLEDQSGSIKDKDIQKFASVLYQSLSYFDEVRIMRHDTKVHFDKTYESSQVNPDQIKFSTHGRGGTSHKECFKRIQDSFENDDDISMIIMLTDFASDIERLWNRYNWTKHIPVSVVLNEDATVPKYVDEKPIRIDKDD